MRRENLGWQWFFHLLLCQSQKICRGRYFLGAIINCGENRLPLFMIWLGIFQNSSSTNLFLFNLGLHPTCVTWRFVEHFEDIAGSCECSEGRRARERKMELCMSSTRKHLHERSGSSFFFSATGIFVFVVIYVSISVKIQVAVFSYKM